MNFKAQASIASATTHASVRTQGTPPAWTGTMIILAPTLFHLGQVPTVCH